MKQLILFFTFFMILNSWIYGQDTCENFEWANVSDGNWEVTNGNLLLNDGVIYPIPNNGNCLVAIDALDESIPTYLYNDTDYSGDLYNGVNKCLNFDYRYFKHLAGTNVSVSKIIYLYKGPDKFNPEFLAYFELNTSITDNGWTNITVPIAPEENGELPSNSLGQWIMEEGTNTDWNTLISNVGGLYLNVDENDFSNFERIMIDNFCVNTSTSPIALFYINGGTPFNGFSENFFCSEDIILKANNSQNYTYRKYSLWRRSISTNGNNPWLWSGVLVSGNTTSINDVNVETQIDTKPPEFPRLEFGFEYKVRLEVSNECGSSVAFRRFRFLEIPNIDKDFTFETNYDNNFPNVYSVTAIPNSNVVPVSHQWELYYALPNGDGIDLDNPVTGIHSNVETVTYDNLNPSETYYIMHAIWKVGCFGWRWTSEKVGPLYLLPKLNSKSNLLREYIHISPNPSKHNSEIQVEISENIQEIELFDMSGKQVQIQSNNIGNNKSSFTLSETVSSGVYVIRVLTEDNNVLIEKLVIE